MNHKAGADYTEKFMVKEVDQQNRDKEILQMRGSAASHPLLGRSVTSESQKWPSSSNRKRSFL